MIAKLAYFSKDTPFAQRITEEFEDVARKPIVYTELKTNEVLTPPKAKLLLTARLKCWFQDSPITWFNGGKAGSGLSRFNVEAIKPSRIISRVAMASIAPQAPMVCPM